MDKIRQIRNLDKHHNFTLVCRDLSEISTYAQIDNTQYRTLKAFTPGAYTFILKATKEVPKRLMHTKRKTIGIRVPDNKIVQALLEELGEPLMSSTLILPNEELPSTDPYEIRQLLEHQLDLIIDGGFCGFEATSVIDLETDEAIIIHAFFEHDKSLSEQRQDVLAGTTSGSRFLEKKYGENQYWQQFYKGEKPIIYGHHVVGEQPKIINNTYSI